jgi:hypothetical protein
MITFSLQYFLFAMFLFITEVLIALYVNDNFVRPYVGDFLVVILIYCAVRTFIKGSVNKIAAGVLLFSYMIEVLQYFHFLELLGLQNNTVARTVLGTSFAWSDLVAYTLGVLAVVLIERMFKIRDPRRTS